MSKIRMYFWRTVNKLACALTSHAQRRFALAKNDFISSQLRSRKDFC